MNMGEIADGMVDGTLCEGCGAYIGEGDGFPMRCSACDDVDDGDDLYDHLSRQQAGFQRRQRADDQFPRASALASGAGLHLCKRSEQHYQLSSHDWLLDVYPGNHRLLRPKPGGKHPKKAPFLDVPYGAWTLMDVVEAAIATTKG
jgi:hypothetical protein